MKHNGPLFQLLQKKIVLLLILIHSSEMEKGLNIMYVRSAYSPIHFKWNQYQSPVQLEKCTGYQSTSPFWIFSLDWSVHQSSPKYILILNFREMKCRNFQRVCSLLLHRNKALIGFNHKLFFKTIIFQNSSKVRE